jgi:DNA-binding CsgD family transcriptional regulator
MMADTTVGQQVSAARDRVIDWLAAHAAHLGTSMDAQGLRTLCTQELPDLIGHRAMFAAVGRIARDDCTVLHAWNFGCPPELFEQITMTGSRSSQPTFALWLKTESPMFIDTTVGADTSIATALTRHGLECRAVHGIVDGCGSLGSCIACFGLCPDDRIRVTEGLRLIVPYLHVSLMRMCREKSMQLAATLTDRERQLIRLVVEGQTNPQIAREWCRSVATVRNLLHVLMNKLGVNTRAQLAVAAIQTGLLDSEIPLPPNGACAGEIS